MTSSSPIANLGAIPIARVDVDRADDRLAWLSAHGEFDLATTDALRLPLVRQLLNGRRAIALNMSAVTFIDVVAVDALVEIQRDFLAAGATLLITNPSRQVSRLLALTGLDRTLLAAYRVATFTD